MRNLPVAPELSPNPVQDTDLAEHTIRLGAAWEAQDLAAPGRPPFRLNLPVDWSGFLPREDSATSRIRLTRRFGRPLGLDPGSPDGRARLVIENGPGIFGIEVNGEAVAWHPSGEARVALDLPPLGPRNVVAIEVEIDASARAWGDVSIVFGGGPDGR